MATWNAGRLLKRLREVLEGSAGTRPTTTSQFVGDLPPGLSVNEESRRALLDSTLLGVPVESRIVSIRRSPASPPTLGNLALFDVQVEIKAVYPIVTAEALTDASRDAVAGFAGKHADEIAQAVGYPGNLSTTNAGQDTGVVSGLLAHVSSDFVWAGEPGKAGTLTGRHLFKGVAKSAPA